MKCVGSCSNLDLYTHAYGDIDLVVVGYENKKRTVLCNGKTVKYYGEEDTSKRCEQNEWRKHATGDELSVMIKPPTASLGLILSMVPNGVLIKLLLM